VHMSKPLLMELVLVTAALACGDKLMLVGGHARLRQIYGARPASILAYMRPDSSVPEIVRSLQLAVRQTGHKFHTVENLSALDEALKAGKYDLLLADISDAEVLQQEARSAPSKPVLLPVVHKSSKAEATAAEKRFHCALKAPGSTSHYLDAIDEAMEIRMNTVR
jgi:hypothetical protein